MPTPQRPVQPPLTEPVEHTHCTRCGQPTLRAHADGIHVKADPQPLTLTGEIRAHLTGRLTWQILAFHDGHLELLARTPTTIQATGPRTVVADHQCCGPLLTTRQIHALPAAVRLTTRQIHALPAAVRLTTRTAVAADSKLDPPF